MKISKRVGALALVVAMLIPFGTITASADLIENENLVEATIYIIDRMGGAKFPTGEVRMDTLEGIRDRYNATLKQLQLFPEGAFGVIYGDLGYAVITEEAGSGVARLIDSKNNFFITDGWGNYPYCHVAGDVPAEDIAVSNVHANKWCGLTERSKEVETVTHDALASAVIELNDAGIECSLVQGYYNEILYWFICTPDYKYYCNSKNEMFVAPAEASATDLNRPYVDDDGNPLDIEKVLDLENNILNLPGDNGLSLELSIGNISYDAGDKSYTVNAYTTINEGDEYYYTYYTYNIQYNITNTYITYIGSNEPYERKEYELYYQLPDGRSSADLTAEEIAGMSFEFYDVVNYQRSTDDVSVRALYHFDGNLEDSSYFTGQHSGLVWTEGASITYMESPGAFEGNLYLDNTAHAFGLSQPSPIGTGDFQIQFRYYQASEIDTVDNIENRLNIGGIVLRWDESRLYNGDIELCALPIGTWNEICVSRYDGRLYIYLNGLCVYSGLNSTFVPRVFEFTFGSTSRAYSMLDEFRVLNVCPIAGATNYSCTNVPYDSNLVLVLPDVDRPLADEYYILTKDPKDLFGGKYDFTGLTYGDEVPGISSVDTSSTYHADMLPHWSMAFAYRTPFTTVSVVDGAISISSSGTSTRDRITGGLALCTGCNLSPNKTYTLTVVLSDYSVHNISFSTYTAGTSKIMTTATRHAENRLGSQYDGTAGDGYSFPGGILRNGMYWRSYSSSKGYYYDSCIVLNTSSSSQPLEIAYMSLVEGTKSAVSVEKVTSIFGRDDLVPNTAAIQTTIPVNGYTVGGVRPTMPTKGDLWFPVMENRITSVQIYAGTHWEEVNARWWTGSRWIPIYAFDINTLEDLFDIADGDGVVSLLPDTNSFFRWWQLQWLDFRAWLEDALANIGSGTGPGSGSDCQHVYSSEVSREPGCVEPGTTLYTCSNCGHQYTELIDAHGHDWITTDIVPDVLDENGTVIEKGYEILTCSVCDVTAKDYGDGPEEDDLFDALGDLLAGGVEWLLDKLSQLADRLRLITDTFTEYIEKVKDFGGEYPAFFAAAFLLIPEELRILFWLAVVGVVVLAVWKKYSS